MNTTFITGANKSLGFGTVGRLKNPGQTVIHGVLDA